MLLSHFYVLESTWYNLVRLPEFYVISDLFHTFPVENLLPGFTQQNFWKFYFSPGDSNRLRRDSEIGCTEELSLHIK